MRCFVAVETFFIFILFFFCYNLLLATALDASEELLAVGASSGSLYVFQRKKLDRADLFSSQEIQSAVGKVKISPDGIDFDDLPDLC